MELGKTIDILSHSTLKTLFANSEEEFSYWQKRFSLEVEMDNIVCQLDPLGADDFFLDILPDFNQKRSPAEIIRMASSIIPSLDDLSSYNLLSARAALRDLGLIAASLRRHDAHLVDFPRLSMALLKLAEITDEVPRDTVFSYGLRNPSDARQRRFTKREEEPIFIKSFADGLRGLNACLSILPKLLTIPSSSLKFGESCRELAGKFELMVQAIGKVRQYVSPEVFTYELRPYFEAIQIGRTSYYAPGGAQMPLLLIDQLLWGADTKDHFYLRYREDGLIYFPPFLREFSAFYMGRKSIMSVITEEYSSCSRKLSATEKNSIQALISFLTRIMSFRMPHQRIAEANFALRSKFALGSGGYTPALLEELIQKTKDARNKLKKLMDKKGRAS